MTRTSLFVLATQAALWPAIVPESSDIRMDDGDVIRFGENASVFHVAETILRHKLRREGKVGDAHLRRELARHGYAKADLRRATSRSRRLRKAS